MDDEKKEKEQKEQKSEKKSKKKRKIKNQLKSLIKSNQEALQQSVNKEKTKSKPAKPETKLKFKSAEESPKQANCRKASNESVKSEVSSQSSLLKEEKQVKLQKMLSESINSYSLDKAYESVGIQTPSHMLSQKNLPIVDLSRSSSAKSSALVCPVKIITTSQKVNTNSESNTSSFFQKFEQK
ncbi:hypothetical protein OXYTRIMIC_770 [Oxytricha trifallax]|uniref:Uncharacterized protein n=1 Tax=Oxytricha trifallax TaxID=1172189 RepID=A0A073HZQ2_9SPIT|nr:hypothetical protein OXYTRIMIC_770 [Oxytricha trifallax]